MLKLVIVTGDQKVKLKHILATFVLVMLGTVVFSGGSASAASFSVATGNDENTNNASCALSEAIENINDGATTNADCSPTGAYGTDDTINLPTGTITLTADLPEIENDIVIAGQSKAGSIVDGDSNAYTAFLVGQTAGVGNAEFRDFSITGAEEVGIAVCATDVTMDNISVSDSGAGAGVVCNNSEETLTIDITDSEFNENNGFGAGIYSNGAGLYLSPAGTCSSPPEINLSRVSANNNTSPISSVVVYAIVGGGCTLSTSLQDVEANGNTGNMVAGLMAISADSGAQQLVTLDRVTVSNNQTIGQTNSPGVAGIYFYANHLRASNTSVFGNTANPGPGSNGAMAGITAMAFGSAVSIDLTNITITDNHLLNSNNLPPSDFSTSGLLVALSETGESLLPAMFTNVLAANNTFDGVPRTCVSTLDLGAGPASVPMTSGGGNVIEDNTCAYALNHSTDQNNVSGLFSTLAAPAYNDGFVQTVALLEGSPAVDAGVAVPFSLDAQLLSRNKGTAVDAGAYESPFSRVGNGGDNESGVTGVLAATGGNRAGAIFIAGGVFTVGVGLAARLRTRRYQLIRS
jgi:hypothetical protein